MENLDWISKEWMDKWTKDYQSFLLWGPPPDKRTEEEKYLDSLKMAFITINGDNNRIAAKVSTLDDKAYSYKDYYETVLPLQEITDFTFDRWWTNWDF